MANAEKSMDGGLWGFMLGLGLTAMLEASGIGAVSTIPTVAILPITTAIGAIRGYFAVEEKKK